MRTKLTVCLVVVTYTMTFINYGCTGRTSLTREILNIHHQRHICQHKEIPMSMKGTTENELFKDGGMVYRCANDTLHVEPLHLKSYSDYSLRESTSGISRPKHAREKRFIRYLRWILRHLMSKFHCRVFCWSSQAASSSSTVPVSRIKIKRPSPNKPPRFKFCPHLRPVYFADAGKYSTVIKWTRPIGEDPEEGRKTPKLIRGKISGSRFRRGNHTINYRITDSRGASANCFKTFQVRVIRCKRIKRPKNGRVKCSKKRFIYGSHCDVTCRDGFRFKKTKGEKDDDDNDSNSDDKKDVVRRIVCEKNTINKGRYSRPVPKCTAVKCSRRDSALKPKNGVAECTDKKYQFGTTCYTKCKDGFRIPKASGLSTVCQINNTWSNALPSCIDAQPPEIQNCPRSFQVYTEVREKTAFVQWKPPTATDNSGNAAVEQTHGLMPSSRFPLGTTEIRYKATDEEGNISPDCIFSVRVEEIQCGRPPISDPFLNYRCPDGYGLGASCQLSCIRTFKLLGNETITCERNDTTVPPTGYWNMGSSYPECGRNPCYKLPAPENGAMACDTWIYGMQCQMQCGDDFDIPYGIVGENVKNFNGIFVCSEKTGKWLPSNVVPGCTERRKPGEASTLGEFFYFANDCNDDDDEDDNDDGIVRIKENFIKHLKYLERNGWDGICPDSSDCDFKNVDVTCSQVPSRTKRFSDFVSSGSFSSLPARVRVQFSVETKWFDVGSSMKDAYDFVKEIHSNLTKLIKKEAIDGKFDVGNYSPVIQSFNFKPMEIKCQDDGYTLKLKSLTCAPCSLGTFLNGDDECENCRHGTYRDNVNDPKCTPCPEGTYTINEASRNASDCIATCDPGFYSETKVQPCLPCPTGTYTSDDGGNQCEACPHGKTTLFSASNSSSDCKNFDVSLKNKEQQMTFLNKRTKSSDITISTWIKSLNSTENEMFMDIVYPSHQVSVTLKDSITIIFTNDDSKNTRTEVFVCSEKLSDRKWTHLSLSYAGEGHVLNIFFNGKNVCSQRESKPKDVDENNDDVDDGDGDDDVDNGDGDDVDNGDGDDDVDNGDGDDDVNDGDSDDGGDGGDSDNVGDGGGNRNDEIDDGIDFGISNEEDDENEKDDEDDNNVTSTWLNVVIGLTKDLSEGYLLSGFSIYDAALETDDLDNISSTCESDFTDKESLYTFDDILTDLDVISPSQCRNFDICVENPCHGHICINTVDSFICQCQNGSYGDHCQFDPDFCTDEPCHNGGTCTNTHNGFVCQCSEGYKGPTCDVPIVNGAWSQWTDWTDCSKTCDGGMKLRTRTCTDPPPDDDGKDCPPAATKEQIECRTGPCPSCPKLSAGSTNVLKCGDGEDGYKVCTVSCKQGYAFVSGVESLTTYSCGPSTDYKWNGRHMPCGKVESPKSLSTVSTVKYKKIPCSKMEEAKEKLEENALSSLQCIKNQSCDMDIVLKEKECDDERRKRSTGSDTVIAITLTKQLERGDNLDLAEYFESNNVSQALSDLILGVEELEATAMQISNDSTFMNLEIDGISYTPSSVETEPKTKCPDGYSKEEAFCVPCPEGTYSGAGFCHPCPIGTYQNETGLSKCKQCRTGYTTAFVGSMSLTDCSEPTNTCGDDFRCSDGRCVDKDLFCNNNPNCEDWSDETNVQCLFGCKPGQFVCADGQCIEGQYMCDGVPHCRDSSDEGEGICEPSVKDAPLVQEETLFAGNLTIIIVAIVVGVCLCLTLVVIVCLCRRSGKSKSNMYTINTDGPTTNQNGTKATEMSLYENTKTIT